MNTIKAIGTAKYQKYVSEVITTRTVSLHQPIKKNSLPLWKRPSSKAATRTSQKIANLMSDCNLFSHLYIALLKTFFLMKITLGHLLCQIMENFICQIKSLIYLLFVWEGLLLWRLRWIFMQKYLMGHLLCIMNHFRSVYIHDGNS